MLHHFLCLLRGMDACSILVLLLLGDESLDVRISVVGLELVTEILQLLAVDLSELVVDLLITRSFVGEHEQILLNLELVFRRPSCPLLADVVIDNLIQHIAFGLLATHLGIEALIPVVSVGMLDLG